MHRIKFVFQHLNLLFIYCSTLDFFLVQFALFRLSLIIPRFFKLQQFCWWLIVQFAVVLDLEIFQLSILEEFKFLFMLKDFALYYHLHIFRYSSRCVLKFFLVVLKYFSHFRCCFDLCLEFVVQYLVINFDLYFSHEISRLNLIIFRQVHFKSLHSNR